MTGPALETVAFRMRLNSGAALEYRRRHEAIWPDLAEALRAAGVSDYRIFLDPESRALFAVMTRRRDHGLDALSETPLMRRWWTMMADIMETHPDAAPVSWPLEEVFCLDADDPPAR